MMLTVSELAARAGVSKQAVSKSVKALADRQKLRVERDSAGRVTKVDAAHYDALRARTSNPANAQAAGKKGVHRQRLTKVDEAPEARPPVQSELLEGSYDEALRQKTWRDTELKRISIQKALGRLVDAAEEADALDRAAVLIRAALARIIDAVDDLAATVAREGARGLRAALKKLVAEAQDDMVSALEAEARRLRDGIKDSPD